MRPPLAFLGLAALLLAGCASPPAPASARVDHVEINGYPDDVDCDGVMDIFIVFRAVGAGSRTPVPFGGSMDALLQRQVVGSTYTNVDNWSAQLAPDKFGPDGTIQWYEQGQKLVPGTYHLSVRALVAGQGNFTAASDLSFQTGSAAAQRRAC